MRGLGCARRRCHCIPYGFCFLLGVVGASRDSAAIQGLTTRDAAVLLNARTGIAPSCTFLFVHLDGLVAGPVSGPLLPTVPNANVAVAGCGKQHEVEQAVTCIFLLVKGELDGAIEAQELRLEQSGGEGSPALRCPILPYKRNAAAHCQY